MGADTKANTRELRGVALEALRESGSFFGAQLHPATTPGVPGTWRSRPRDTPEVEQRGRGRQHEDEQPHIGGQSSKEGQSSDCIVLPQLLHRDTAHRPRSRAGHSCEQQLVWWLTLALDAAAQGCTAKRGIVGLLVYVDLGVFLLHRNPIHLPHRLHIHHEAEAVQPCQLRQLATCHHHLPRPFSLFEALHVQVGDGGKACGLRLPLTAAQPVA
eukprot:scaffold133301_cov72-Phaeocystis_antarctica.AAC.3